MSYYVTTFCSGDTYTPIVEKWIERIKQKCVNSITEIFTSCSIHLNYGLSYAWWDVVRLHNNINLLKDHQKPVVHIDLDIIIEKDIEPIVELPYDIIISTEIGKDEAYPKECSKILGFGVCSGFYVIKPTALKFMTNIYNLMINQHYNNYSDQVTLMNYIVNNEYTISYEEIEFDSSSRVKVRYMNTIIHIDQIKICVLDFNIIIRDPINSDNQFGNHINIGNVGGTQQFLRYFDEPLESLPLTCRCGKIHLGDSSVCKHIEIRNIKNSVES